MPKLLKTKERTDLIQRHRKERDDRVRDRIKALLLYVMEYAYSEIAYTFLGISGKRKKFCDQESLTIFKRYNYLTSHLELRWIYLRLITQ